ncbi:MAG: MerR family transcriptional regulator [Candidatus Scalinduaceae bacterium]
MNALLTISEVAERVGVSTRTIQRWEATGRVKKAKRDRRGWRVFDHDDVEDLITFHNMVASFS